MKIGLPRALYYFHYGPLWEGYLEGLGFEVIVSAPTNKEILNQGLMSCVDGACFPLKTYVGHAQFLAKKGVDFLFVPEIIGVWRQEFICTNFLGLPDLVKQYMPATTSFLRPVLDGRKGIRRLKRQYLRFGLTYTNRKQVQIAWEKGMAAQREWEERIRQRFAQIKTTNIKLMLLGPRYLIDDPYLNGNLIENLEKIGVQVLTPALVADETGHFNNQSLAKPFFWASARYSVGALKELLPFLDGVIVLIPFGCGAQSFVAVVTEDLVEAQSLPVLTLHLDEHTSELGTLTRLEAFCDLLERKRA